MAWGLTTSSSSMTRERVDKCTGLVVQQMKSSPGTCNIYQLNTAALYAALKTTQKSVSSNEGKRGTFSSMDAALDSREQSGCAGRSRQSPNSFSNCNPQHSEKRVLANAIVNAYLVCTGHETLKSILQEQVSAAELL